MQKHESILSEYCVIEDFGNSGFGGCGTCICVVIEYIAPTATAMSLSPVVTIFTLLPSNSFIAVCTCGKFELPPIKIACVSGRFFCLTSSATTLTRAQVLSINGFVKRSKSLSEKSRLIVPMSGI